MKTFIGYRTPGRGGERGEAVVTVLETGKPPRPLNPRIDLRCHSPTGLEWSYGGSGPAQLALALATEVLGDDERAEAVYQKLKWELVVGLEQEGWTLTEARILERIVAIESAEELVGD